jgi:CRISPR/Cas system-associated exonuclease Cas4 (RecB family)
MEFPYRPEQVEEAGAHFDRVVERILRKDYQLHQTPEPKVCQECDLRVYCSRQGTIKIKG